MKFFAQVFCMLFLATGLYSCKKSTAELVEGRWRIEDVTQTLPDSDPQLKAYYEDQLRDKNAELLESGYYEFKKDGKGFFELKGERMEGRWRLSENEKTIFFKEENDTNEVPFEIKEISDNTFIMELDENGQVVRIVMKKAHK